MRSAGWNYLVLAAIAVCTSACSGWYLRGTQAGEYSIRTVHVDANNAANLRTALIQGLSNSGLGFAARNQAQAVVEIANERFDRRVLSVDPETGKVREVELEMAAEYTVRAGNGTLLAPKQTAAWVNEFVFDEGSLLGTVEQEQLLRVDLANDAARTILLRLQTLELPATGAK